MKKIPWDEPIPITTCVAAITVMVLLGTVAAACVLWGAAR